MSSTLPSVRLKDLIETTGRRAVIKGLGATKSEFSYMVISVIHTGIQYKQK